MSLSSSSLADTRQPSIDPDNDWFEMALETPTPRKPLALPFASSWDDDDDEADEPLGDDEDLPGEVAPIEPEEDPFDDFDEEDFDDDFDDDFEEELEEEYDIEPDDDGMVETETDDDDLDDDIVPDLGEEVD